MRWELEPWRKLYRREEGSFALLPLYVRSLAAELLKFVDDDGRFFVGSHEPWEAIARTCGATTGDRRMLRQHVPMLLTDGYLVRDGDYIRIRNLRPAQGRGRKRVEHEPDANRTRAESEPSASGERTEHEPERVEHEPDAKSESSARNDSGPPLVRASASEDPIRSDPNRSEETSPPAGARERQAGLTPAEQTVLARLEESPPPICYLATLEYVRGFVGNGTMAGASAADICEAISAAGLKLGEHRRASPEWAETIDALADHVGAFIAKQPKIRLGRGAPRSAPTDVNATRVRDFFGKAWTRRTGERYCGPDQDLPAAAELWEAATIAAERARGEAPGRETPDAEAHARHWIKRYFEDEDRSVSKATWPLAWLPRRIGAYGSPPLPKPLASAPARLPPLRGAPPPPEVRALGKGPANGPPTSRSRETTAGEQA